MIVPLLMTCMGSPFLGGCSSSFVSGAAAGAVGGGAAYEYQNKKQMDRPEKDYREGHIDKDEYLKRKEQIEHGSIIY